MASAMMSRLPVADIPSTCHVSFTSTSSTGARKRRGNGLFSSSSSMPDNSTQSAWVTPVPNCQCPDSS